MLGAEPVEPVAGVVVVVPGVVVVVVGVALVAVVAGVVVAGVLDVPGLAAAPAGWVVTNCVRAASRAEYNLPPPWAEPVLGSESLSAGPFRTDDEGAPSKDDRLMVVAAATVFVDMLHSLLCETR
ncbi:MAG: hypothetical protein JWN43_36 [Gammaproteobacteria bacterium]|nr:hypothetical protein [Gammaproteobacteria bacterium]